MKLYQSGANWSLRAGFELAKNDLVISFDIDYYSESFLCEALMLNSEYSSITASKTWFTRWTKIC